MIRLLKRLKRNPKLMWNYFIGNYRSFLYSSRIPLIRKHIREQYEWRLTLANKECLDNGSCIKCGCKTPNLLFSPEACEGACYSRLVSKKLWKKIKEAKQCL